MARGTATDKLVDVIQMLQMSRKTGILHVNRDASDNTVEQGAVMLQNGQITDASLGPYRGAEAFQRLQGWSSCYFVFQTSTHPPQGARQPPSSGGHGSPSLPPTQMSPVNRNPASGFGNTGPLPNRGAGFPNTGPLPNRGAGFPNTSPLPMRGPSGARNAPQRTREVSAILPHFNRLGLTRLHRQLFLLIDGQRSVPELILLIGHRTDEVDTLLDDLERAGLIRW
jgi:hypothetical protein